MTKSKRWKPEIGDSYCFIGSCIDVDYERYDGHSWDEERFAAGNYFKTPAEAEAAVEKVRELLLSLHEPATECSRLVTSCNQLPKLTTEVFNHPDCPEWAKYAAVAMGGNVIYFSNKPYPDDIAGVWHGAKKWAFISSETGGTLKCNASDWQNILIERPAKLPDWCKVGEWVWSDGNYYEVIETGADWFRTSRNGDTGLWGANILHQFSQARLRPYNTDEMKALVGKPITMLDGAVCLCTAYNKRDKSVILDNIYWDAQELLGSGYTIDNKPCGKFEHLEDGEWVK